MIQVADGFRYQGSKPLDERLKYDSIADMKAVSESALYDGCFAYVTATQKYYSFDSSNETDETLGKWREFQTGGGGHAIEDSEGTSLEQRTVMQFGEGLLAEDDATNEKTVVKPDAFQEGDMDDVVDILPSGGRVVATGFTPIGTIIPVMGVHAPKNFLICDGTVYNIADYPELASYFEREFDESNHFGGDGTTTFAVPDLRGEFIRGAGTNGHTGQGSGAEVGEHQDATKHLNIVWYSSRQSIYQGFSQSGIGEQGRAYLTDSYPDGVTVAYRGENGTGKASTVDTTPPMYTARPTNTSVLFCIAIKDIYTNPINDYSTEEKVVGSWIDGSTIYQKTISCGALPNSTLKDVPHGISNLDRIISISGVGKNPTSLGQIPIPYVQQTAHADGVFVTSTNIVLSTISDRSGVTEVYVTLQYTKS